MNKIKEFVKNYNIFKKNKFFKSKTNIFISVVALVECVVLIGVMTFAWIESSSSLVIKGEDLPISSNLNYRFDVQETGTTSVDLSTYFRPTALYQLAQCSTADGENFYFKKDGQTTYRLGDTTDYNTSYYNFDFQVHNVTSKNFNYYFSSADIFTVTSDDESVTDDLKTVVAEAMRICVTTGTTSKTTLLFSKESESYNAVTSTAAAVAGISTKGLSGSDYVYNGSNTENGAVFKSTHGGEDTKVNVKIWFEEKDPEWVALTAQQRELLLGCTININLKFMNSASDFQTFMFDDYTFSTVSGHLGKPTTTEDANKNMYFCYSNGTTTEVVPMIITSSDGDAIRWITSDGSGNATPRISKDVIDDITANPTYGYFFYGTVSSAGAPVVTYKWALDANSTPTQNDGGSYIYQALSVTKDSKGAAYGFGVWGNKAVELIQFVDRTTCATANAYNEGGYRFVVNGGQGALYLNNTGLYKKETTQMYYDASADIWKGYYLSDNRESLKFMYSSDGLCGANIKCVWSATSPEKVDGTNYIYTALGYSDCGIVDDFTSSLTVAGTTSGVGTWLEVEKIRLSAELMDIGINADIRYKVGLATGTTYYYMAKDNTDLHYFAYVVKDYGNSTANVLGFQYYSSATETQAGSTWNSVIKALRDGSDTYYLTGRNTGQWHIAVVVDGSAMGIINDTLTNVAGAKLEYSTDNETWYDMIKLDDYRWYADDFAGTVTKLYYRYTAYPHTSSTQQDGAIFTYGHDLTNGIYFNITE